MRPALSLAISLFLLTSAACAMDFNNLQKYVNIYNNKIGSAPPIIRGMIGNENVDFTIALQNGSILRWGMEMENAAIVRSGYGGLKNPTIAVHATEGAIDRVLGAADPMDAYKEAERSGQMKIECMTWMSGIKVSAAISAGEAVKPFLSSLKN